MFLKIIVLLIKNSTLFSIKGLRTVRNSVFRKYYKAEKMFVADRVTISTAHYNKSAYFRCHGQVNLGADVYIDYSGGVEIFEMVAISEGSKIFTHNHSIHDGKKDWTKNPIKFSSLKIGKYAWIGAGSIILPSVAEIAEGTVVAAGSVLTKNTEPYGVYAGNPAIKITNRRINE